MDVNDLRITATVAGFVLFIVLWVWIFFPKNKQYFEDSARIPFEEN